MFTEKSLCDLVVHVHMYKAHTHTHKKHILFYDLPWERETERRTLFDGNYINECLLIMHCMRALNAINFKLSFVNCLTHIHAL